MPKPCLAAPSMRLYAALLISVGGVAPALADQAGYELGVVATWQHASDDRVRAEGLASVDLAVAYPVGPGTINAYIEGSTSQKSHGVSLLLGEANADAGTALDANQTGRLQLSELSYTLPAGGGELTAGLVDLGGPLDNSDVANDEGAQFLGASFVNNPTIEFPDYTVGGWYHRPLDAGGSGLTLLLGSTVGIADTDDAEYSSVFDLDNVGSGAFAALEWQGVSGGVTTRLGLWGHSADHQRLDGNADDDINYGIYLSADTRLGDAGVNLRLGAANPAVSPAATFAALASELPVRSDLALGVGVAFTGVSGDLAGQVDDMRHGELYLRWQATPELALTPSVQYLENSGFDASGASYDPSLWVAGVRLSVSL